ncbi:uncharacterized protein [Battus philenor]|uniref:uncharacterized protein n=1 Tax=Battus philenor TaxID=42288 RepID=UPI0035D04690
MWTSMWFTSVFAILVADIRTGALLNKDIEPRKCYQCSNAYNVSTCGQEKTLTCPVDQPYCGTVAVGPSFASTLKCLPAFNTSCLTRLSSNSTIEISCICTGELCNAPFSKKIQNGLFQFAKTTTIDNVSDITYVLFKYLKVGNETDLYKLLTNNNYEDTVTSMPKFATTPTVTKLTEELIITNHSNEVDIPHAEPLKHEATVPPDDDEDENEGSGSYDDTKLQKNTASAPAAPSSYLPAEENKASTMFKNTLAVVCLIIYVIL